MYALNVDRRCRIVPPLIGTPTGELSKITPTSIPKVLQNTFLSGGEGAACPSPRTLSALAVSASPRTSGNAAPSSGYYWRSKSFKVINFCFNRNFRKYIYDLLLVINCHLYMLYTHRFRYMIIVSRSRKPPHPSFCTPDRGDVLRISFSKLPC